MGDTMEVATMLAEVTYKAMKAQGDCGNLTLQWMQEKLWGKIAEEEIIPATRHLFDQLKEKGHDRKNPAVLGDIDYSTWYEEPKENIKVIVTTCHCSCADDNTTIYWLDDRFKDVEYEGDTPWVKFKIMTAWPRETSKRKSYKWNDDRDIEKPSIHTYRKRKWKFGYSDSRDLERGFVLSYDSMQGMAEGAIHTQTRIAIAQDVIGININLLKHEYNEEVE